MCVSILCAPEANTLCKKKKCLLSKFQLEYDTKNQQAKDSLQRIKPLKGNIAEAKDMFQNGDHQAAIELLTKAIEVSELEIFIQFHI